jgi:hypothetical protein
MCFARNRDLASGDPVLRFRRPVVDEPQVGIRGAGPSDYSIAVARMRCIRLMGVVVTAVVDKYLECLRVTGLDAVLQSKARGIHT